jgi:hypothetical protein
MRIKSNIETKCKGMKLKKKKTIDKLLKTIYTIIKKNRIKFDTKINCKWMKLKKQINSTNN